MNFKKSNKYHLHPMNYQTNPRNILITNENIRSLLAKLEIYDGIITNKTYILQQLQCLRFNHTKRKSVSNALLNFIYLNPLL